jgi:hypothetical protein
MELRYIGKDGSQRWIPDLDRCAFRSWLLPKGESPFAVTSFYYDHGPLFSEEFRRAFFSNYELTSNGQIFDVWTCKHS